VPAATGDVVERDADRLDLFGREAGARDHEAHLIEMILVVPPRRERPLVPRPLDPDAVDQARHAARLEQHARPLVLEAGRQTGLPDVGRLDDVVVDADDAGDRARSRAFGTHACSFTGELPRFANLRDLVDFAGETQWARAGRDSISRDR